MDKLIDVVPVLDTGAYASGEVLFDWTLIARGTAQDYQGGAAVLQSLHLTDKSDNKTTIEVYFGTLNAATLGTPNAAPTIGDAGAVTLCGAPVVLDTYFDLGGVAIAGVDGIGKVVRSADREGSLYMAAIVRGAPTYAQGDLAFRVGLI